MSLTVVVTQGGTPTTYTATADAEACLELLRLSILAGGTPTYASIADMILAGVNNNSVQPALRSFTPSNAVASAITKSLSIAALQAAMATAGSTAPPALRNLWPPSTANVQFGAFTDSDAQYGTPYVAAPDGSGQALHIEETGTTASHMFYVTAGNLGAGQHTISMYLKPDTRTWVYLRCNVDGVTKFCWFDLSGGVVGTNGFPAGATAAITLGLLGFYRCSVTFTAATSANDSGCGLTTADTVWSHAGTAGHGCWQWGQQIEHGPLTDYQAISL